MTPTPKELPALPVDVNTALAAVDALYDMTQTLSTAGERIDAKIHLKRQIIELATVAASLQGIERDAAPRWQPIETAPQDGTEFLGYRRGVVASSRRVPRDDCEMWAFGVHSGAVEFWPEVKPSHWMPLPIPPDAAMKDAP